MTTRRTTTIERCTGIHSGTGLPVMETHTVRTEHEYEEDADDEHEAEVRIAQYERDPRETGWMCLYQTGERLRRATGVEYAESLRQAIEDGGRGVVMIEGHSVYVED